jgi:hypothetical protein
MLNIIFTAALAFIIAAIYAWGFHFLPKEGWQFFAAVPVKKKGDSWIGCNLTWYGIISAFSTASGAALFLILIAASGIPLFHAAAFLGLVLAAAVPSAKIIAAAVEKKKHTISVGAALFVGILVSVPALSALNLVLSHFNESALPLFPVMASAAVAYSFSEGIGRLACLSFGCCYGRRVSSLNGIMKSLFSVWNIRFRGETKKISYASGWEGKKVIPVQKITSILYAVNACAGTYLFLSGNFRSAFAAVISVILLWRVFSEFLRADFRGAGSVFSVYSAMALTASIYCLFVAWFFPSSPSDLPDIAKGLAALRNAGTLTGLELIWVLVFLYMGRSEVTGSVIHFHVRKDRV